MNVKFRNTNHALSFVRCDLLRLTTHYNYNYKVPPAPSPIAPPCSTLLVSTHVVCWRLTAMTDSRLGLENFLLILPRIPYSWQRTPPPRTGLELLMEDLESLGMRLPRIPPFPRKWKFDQDLGLWVLGCQEYTEPNANLVRTWHFEF